MFQKRAIVARSSSGEGIMKRDVSMSLPNWRPTATRQRQKKIMAKRNCRMCLPTDRARGGVIMQTRTAGRLALPKQQTIRRERVAQYGNTRMIPSVIRDPGNQDDITEKFDPAAATSGLASKEAKRSRYQAASKLEETLNKMEEAGAGGSPQAKQIRYQIRKLRQYPGQSDSVMEISDDESYVSSGFVVPQGDDHDDEDVSESPEINSRREAMEPELSHEEGGKGKEKEERECPNAAQKANIRHPRDVPGTPIAARVKKFDSPTVSSSAKKRKKAVSYASSSSGRQ